MTRDERIAIAVGGVNGFLLFLGIAAMTLDAPASWQLAAIAAVLGLVATWRGASYVRRFLERRMSLSRATRDGFALLFLAAVVYVASGLLVAQAGDAAAEWGWPFWRGFLSRTLLSGLVVGLFGALVGFVLGAMSALVAAWFRPIDPTLERLRRRHKPAAA